MGFLVQNTESPCDCCNFAYLNCFWCSFIMHTNLLLTKLINSTFVFC